MKTRHPIEQILLCLFLMLAAFVMGGGLYELRVVLPLWAHAPPESVWHFASERVNNPLYTPNSGLRFWIYVTPAHLVVSIATLIAAWKTRAEHRRWVIISTLIFIGLHLAALFYFVPAVERLMMSRQLNMDPAEVVSRARWWVNLTWGRFVIGLLGYVAGIKAMKTHPEVGSRGSVEEQERPSGRT